MTDVAKLSVEVKTDSVKKGASDLDRLANSAETAGKKALNTKPHVDGLGKAVDDVGDKALNTKPQIESLDKSIDALGTEAVDAGKKVTNTRRDLDALGSQAVTTGRQVEQSAKKADAGLNTMAGSMRNAQRGMQGVADSSQIAAGSVASLTSQFNDIGVMLAAGQNPLQLAIQQGTQINQVFDSLGGGRRAISGLGQAFMAMVSPTNLATLAAIAGGAALTQWAMGALSAGDSAEKFQDDIDALGDAISRYQDAAEIAGLSTEELNAKFGEASSGLRETINLLREISAEEAQRQIDGLSNSISQLLGTSGAGESRAGLASFFDVNIMLAFTDAQRDAREQARQLTAEFQNQQAALQTTNGDLDAQIAATSQLLQTAVELADLSGDRTDAETELINQLSDALDLMLSQKETTASTKLEYEDLLGLTDGFRARLDEAYDSAVGVASAVSGINFYDANLGAAQLVARLRAAWGFAAALANQQAVSGPDGPFTFGTGVPGSGSFTDVAFGTTTRFSPSNAPPDWVEGWNVPPRGGRGGRRRGGRRGGRGGMSDAEREAQRLRNEREREAARIMEEVEKATFDAMTATQQYNAELADLNELHEMGYLSAEEHAAAARHLADEYNAMKIEPIQRQFEDLIGTLVSARKAGEDVGEALRNWVLDAILKAQIQALSKSLAGLFGGIGGGGGGFFSFLFGGARALGGGVTAGRAYQVGENGPETFVPSSSGTIIPNGGAGKLLVDVGVTVDDDGNMKAYVKRVSQAEIQRAGPEIVGQSVKAVQRGSRATKDFLG